MPEQTPLSRYLSIFPGTEEEGTLRLLVTLGMNIAKADEGSLLVLDKATNELVFAITVGNTESEASLIGQRVPLGRGITGLAAMTREVQIGSPTSTDITQPQNLLGEPKSVLAAPILAGDNVTGVITAVSFKPEFRFSGRDVDTYAGFTSVAGIVIEQRRRLAMYESGDARCNSETELTERGRRELAIFQSLRAILHNRPDSIGQVAVLLSAVEALAAPNNKQE